MNLTNKKFGRLLVICRNGSNKKCSKWKCRCDCGNICDKLTHHLTAKVNGCKSCGCLKQELKQGDILTCKICNEELSSKEFPYNSASHTTRKLTCRICFRNEMNLSKKKRNKEVRLAALKAYSKDLICDCCSEKNVEFLTIDHINGNGNKYRKKIGGGSGAIYRWLRDNNYPKGFRVLCMNCNYSIGIYGYCPHKR